MHNSQINIRYAKSLLLIAEEKNIVDEIRQDIDLIFQWFNENEDANILLEHPVIKSSRKSEILVEIFQGKINEITLSFLKLIIKNKRENHIKDICRDFIHLYKQNKGIKTSVLTTSFELTRTHKENIKKSIEQSFKCPVELETKVNQDLIGGIIIQVDDKQLDLSIARQIQELRNKFVSIDFNNKKK